jgi:hypothetical protein
MWHLIVSGCAEFVVSGQAASSTAIQAANVAGHVFDAKPA